MLPHDDLIYRAYYQYKMGELAPKLVHPSYLLPLPTSTFCPSILVLEWVVPFVPSSSGAEVNPFSLSRPPNLPRTIQPPVASFVPMTAPSANKENEPRLSNSCGPPSLQSPDLGGYPSAFLI